MQFKHFKNDFKKRLKRKQKALSYFFNNFHKKLFIYKTPPIRGLLNSKVELCKSKIKYSCLSSSLQRTTNINKFRVSRHRFKLFASRNKFAGVRKAS